MRELIDLIDNVLQESARGLLYRDAGDTFFQGNKDNPTAVIVFQDVKYYPSQPGAYSDYNEMKSALDDIVKQYPGIQWSNTPTSSSKAFAILTFDGPANKQKTYFGRFFGEISNDMAGRWKNSGLPGGWQLNKTTSLKENYYRLKPNDVFDRNSTFDSVDECIATLLENPKNNEHLEKLMSGVEMLLNNQLPTFTNVKELETAIENDFGEIIGPIALVKGLINTGGAEEARKDILGEDGSFEDCGLNFPADKNNGLVDSYLLHPSGIEIGISSKGSKGSTSSVKNIADGIATARQKRMTKLLKKYKDQIDIIEEISNLSSVDFPLVFGERQGIITSSQSDIIRELISQGVKDINEYKLKSSDKKKMLELMSQYQAKPNSLYNVGYHVLSSLSRLVIVDINADPLFSEAALKFLNISPIIELKMTGSKKGNNFTVTGFTSKYPPNFQGKLQISVSKVYAATGVFGRPTFLYNSKETSEPTIQEPTNLDKEIERDRLVGPGVRAAKTAHLANKDSEKVLGRSRRKR